MTSPLFEPGRIGTLELKNRLVRSATYEAMADDSGVPDDRYFELYRKLAAGGVGLIVTGHAYVARDGSMPKMAGIDRDDLIPRYRELTGLVHGLGGKIAMQVNHGGAEAYVKEPGFVPFSPSPTRSTVTMLKSREMREAEIDRVAGDFGAAARRIREAGFDAVQVHAAHSYLICQFLTAASNHRSDGWGGPLEGRLRFLGRVYDEVRRAVGPDFPVLIKMSLYDLRGRRGLALEEGVEMAVAAAGMGFDAIETSCGTPAERISTVRGGLPIKAVTPVAFSEGYNREAARAVKRRVTVPVLAVGGNVNPVAMEDVLRNGDADFVSMCRALIMNPDWPNRLAAGSREPVKCLHCNHCMFFTGATYTRCHYGRTLAEQGKA